MSELPIGQSPFFSRGLERIVTADAQPAPQLPQTRRLLPVEDPGRSALDQLLAAPSFDTLVDDTIRPQVNDPALLSPMGFTSGLQSARQAVGQALDRATRDPDDRRSPQARVLARAERFLGEQLDLRAQAQAQANALYAG